MRLEPGADGQFRREITVRRGACGATLAFHAHALGIIDMRLLLPEAPSAQSEFALYEELQALSLRGYTCVIAREGSGLLVRSLLGTARVEGETDDPFPWAWTPDGVERWLRASLAGARQLLRAYLCAPRRAAGR